MISSSLKSMGEFFNIGGVQKTKIPFNAIQIFLDEKGLEKHLSKLHEVFSDDANSRLELNDTVKLLTSIMPEKIEISPEPEKGEEVVEEDTLLVETERSKEFYKEPEIIKEKEYKEEKEEEYAPADNIIEEEKYIAEEEVKIEEKAEEKEIFEELADEETGFEIKDDEEDLVKNLFMKSDDNEQDELPAIEEEKETVSVKKEFEDEIVIEHEKDSDDEWVFVEEEEHIDLIKEIARPAESDAKKNKPGKKKISDDDEDLKLFDENENEDKMFSDILHDEEKAYKEDVDVSGSYDETHKDFTKLLEHKNMSNIIDILFDNDIEEVELMLNSISFFTEYTEAEKFIDTYFVKMGVKLDSVEAVTFKKIIRDNYNTGRQ